MDVKVVSPGTEIAVFNGCQCSVQYSLLGQKQQNSMDVNVVFSTLSQNRNSSIQWMSMYSLLEQKQQYSMDVNVVFSTLSWDRNSSIQWMSMQCSVLSPGTEIAVFNGCQCSLSWNRNNSIQWMSRQSLLEQKQQYSMDVNVVFSTLSWNRNSRIQWMSMQSLLEQKQQNSMDVNVVFNTLSQNRNSSILWMSMQCLILSPRTEIAVFNGCKCSVQNSLLEQKQQYSMDVNVVFTTLSWDRNSSIQWMSMQCSLLSPGTEIAVFNGCQCSVHYSLLGQKQQYSMDVNVVFTTLSWDRNSSIQWMSMQCSVLSPGTEIAVFNGCQCSVHYSLLGQKQQYSMDVNVVFRTLSWNRNSSIQQMSMQCSVLSPGTEIAVFNGCQCSVQYSLLEQKQQYSMDVNVVFSILSWNRNSSIQQMSMQCSVFSPGTEIAVFNGCQCSVQYSLLEQKQQYSIDVNVVFSTLSWDRNSSIQWMSMQCSLLSPGTEIAVFNGCQCSVQYSLLEQKQQYSMDVNVVFTTLSWDRNSSIQWMSMQCSVFSPGTEIAVFNGCQCSVQYSLLEQKQQYSMDVNVVFTTLSWDRNSSIQWMSMQCSVLSPGTEIAVFNGCQCSLSWDRNSSIQWMSMQCSLLSPGTEIAVFNGCQCSVQYSLLEQKQQYSMDVNVVFTTLSWDRNSSIQWMSMQCSVLSPGTEIAVFNGCQCSVQYSLLGQKQQYSMDVNVVFTTLSWDRNSSIQWMSMQCSVLSPGTEIAVFNGCQCSVQYSLLEQKQQYSMDVNVVRHGNGSPCIQQRLLNCKLGGPEVDTQRSVEINST